MSKRSIMFIREFMATTTNHWTFLPVVYAFAALKGMTMIDLLGWSLVGVLPSILFLVREYVQSILLQLCFFPIYMGILVLLPVQTDVLKGIYLFMVMVYILLSAFMSIKRDHVTKILPPFIALGIGFALALFVFPNMQIYQFPFVLLLSTVIAVLFFFLAFYLDQYLIFIIRNEETSSSMPKSKIFRSGMILSGYYLGIGAVLLFVISSFAISEEFIGSFWIRIKGILREGIRWLLNLFGKAEHDSQIQDGGEGMPWKFEEVPHQAPSLFWKVLEILLFVIVAIIIAYAVIWFILTILRLLYRIWPRRVQYEAEEEVESIDLHETLSHKTHFFQETYDERDMSIRQRIRKIFKKRAIRSHVERERLPYHTAREITVEEYPLLADLYEKARYSNLDCRKEELSALQQSLRKK